MNNQNTYKLLTATILIVILIPWLVQEGMFLDGITYATISKNLANGIGDFWNLHYTQTLDPVFRSHPPLAFGLEAIVFKIFGNNFYSERIYTFITAILTALGVILIWNLFSKKSEQKKGFWLPILLWITIPVISWSYKNNMLENSVSVFAIFSVFFILKSHIDKKIIYIFPASIFIVAAFLSKGFVGIFPLITSFIYVVIFEKIKINKSALISFLMFLMPFGIYFILTVFYPKLKESIDVYINQQLIPSVKNQKEVTANSHFDILFTLFVELLVPVLILLFLVLKNFFKEKVIKIENKKEFIFFILVAISASIPLIITLKQRRFYLVPSIPFYVLSLSFVIYPYILKTIDKISQKTNKIITSISLSVLLFTVIFSFLKFGNPYRDKKLINDITIISQYIGTDTTISTTKELWYNWKLHAYFARKSNISLDCDDFFEYFLIDKNTDTLEDYLLDYHSINL
ncbi:MAG: glycosyltransferase family 39 protein, partial [Bacteroidales bacterium]|nr:glycosyltransferase family 39 protein [Bacteroidales bacterium]